MTPTIGTITAAELADRIGGQLDGDPQRPVHTMANVDDATPETATWIAGQRWLDRLDESHAGVVIAPEQCKVPERFTAIYVDDVELAACDALKLFAPPSDAVPTGIHPSAHVSSDATTEGAAIAAGVFVGSCSVVGSGTQIHHGVFVGRDSRIGQDCVIAPGVVIRDRVTIGDRVTIHPNTTIASDGFGYVPRHGEHKKIPQIGSVLIEDDVEIGANCAIDRAKTGRTRIGAGTKIDNLVHIGHNVDIGRHCIITGQCGVAGSATIGDNTVIGGQSGISDHATIGPNVRIAAKSSVFGNVQKGAAVRGIPAMEIGHFNKQVAAGRKLPEYIRRVRDLANRITAIEQLLRAMKNRQ